MPFGPAIVLATAHKARRLWGEGDECSAGIGDGILLIGDC